LSIVEKLSREIEKAKPRRGKLAVPEKSWQAIAYHFDALWLLLTPAERLFVRDWKNNLWSYPTIKALWGRLTEKATRDKDAGRYQKPFKNRDSLPEWIKGVGVRKLQGVGTDEKG
jgi:hypothetical protein